MRIDVNSLSVGLRRIISRLVITGSRYEKIERKVHFHIKVSRMEKGRKEGEGSRGNGVEFPRVRHSRPRNK